MWLSVFLRTGRPNSLHISCVCKLMHLRFSLCMEAPNTELFSKSPIRDSLPVSECEEKEENLYLCYRDTELRSIRTQWFIVF
jgi:hypothetical protein